MHAWEKTRPARRLERGKIKARGERFFPFPIVSRSPVSSCQRSHSRIFFFHWCLLTGASAEERGLLFSVRSPGLLLSSFLQPSTEIVSNVVKAGGSLSLLGVLNLYSLSAEMVKNKQRIVPAAV